MLDSYHFIPILLIVVFGYIISQLLVVSGRLKLISHRRFWNYILLSSFLISGALGVVLTFMVDYKMSIAWYREFLWVHVEAGIVMAVISVFHIIWHWRYFWKNK